MPLTFFHASLTLQHFTCLMKINFAKTKTSVTSEQLHSPLSDVSFKNQHPSQAPTVSPTSLFTAVLSLCRRSQSVSDFLDPPGKQNWSLAQLWLSTQMLSPAAVVSLSK